MSFLGSQGVANSVAGIAAGVSDVSPGSGFNAGDFANSLNAVGSIASGISQSNAARENEKIQFQNELIAQQATADKIRERRRKIGRDFATQKTQFLNSGVELEGSPLLVLEETIELGEQDINALERTGAAQSKQARLKGKAARTTGNAALAGSLLKAGKTLLTKKQTAVKIE